jgi:hypothetical protein
MDTPSQVAATIINLMSSDMPKAELYSMIHRLIIKMLSLACEEQAERWRTPSSN